MKKLNVAMLLVLSSVALAACGGNTSSETSSSETSSEVNSSTVVTSDSSVEVSSDVVSSEESSDVESSEESSAEKTKEELVADVAAKLVTAKTEDAQFAWNVANFSFGNQYAATESTFAKFFDENGTISVLHAVTSYSSDTTYYYHTSSGEAHAYKVNDDTEKVTKDNVANDKIFVGPSLTYSNIFNPNYVEVYGAEEALDLIVQAMQANANRDLDIVQNGDVYEFSFCYATEGEWKSYYSVSGSTEFKDGSFLKKLNLEVSNLMSGDIIVDDERGTFTLVDGAVLNPNTFDYEAVEGVAVEHPLPYNEADFLFTAFTLGDENMSPIADSSTVDLTISNSFVIINLLSSEPSSGSSDFDPFHVTVTDADGIMYSYDYAYNSYSNCFQFQVSGPGLYEVIISTLNVSHSFTVNAKAPSPTSFEFYNVEFNEYGSSDMALPDTLYIGNTYNIKASSMPFDAPKGYTLTIATDQGQNYPVEPVCKQGQNWDGSSFDYYEFTPTVEANIVVTATSTVDPTVSTSRTLSITNVPSLDTVFHDTLVNVNMRGGYIVWYLDFVLNGDTDACDGTVTISNQNRAASANYTFEFDGNVAALVKVDGDDLGFENATLSVDANLTPYFNIDRGNDWIESLNLQVYEEWMDTL